MRTYSKHIILAFLLLPSVLFAQQEHPKIIAFFKAIGNDSMQEGTIIAVKVTTPDGKEIESNIKITANDITTFQQMMEIARSK